MVHATQNGFFPGRIIHDTLNILTAARALVAMGQAFMDFAVVILDFFKAYDSLDRGVLERAHFWHGLPEEFVQAAAVLHRDSTESFLANRYESEPVDMRDGIRQGCPLAPLLSVLALDPHTQQVQSEQELSGEMVPAPGGSIRVPIAGYADDTALYANSAEGSWWR